MNTYPIETELYTVSPVFTSVWALLIYAVLLALMIIIGVRYYASYKLKEDMPNYAEKRIAKYKAEIERQKEMITRLQNEKREIEIEHKHKEIAKRRLLVMNIRVNAIINWPRLLSNIWNRKMTGTPFKRTSTAFIRLFLINCRKLVRN